VFQLLNNKKKTVI